MPDLQPADTQAYRPSPPRAAAPGCLLNAACRACPRLHSAESGAVSAVVVEVDGVRRVCFGLPGVSERESWGRPAWFARRMLARVWDEGILTVKTDERDALAAQADTYFWTPHHDRSPLLLLVRMDRIDELTLRELLAPCVSNFAYRCRASQGDAISDPQVRSCDRTIGDFEPGQLRSVVK